MAVLKHAAWSLDGMSRTQTLTRTLKILEYTREQGAYVVNFEKKTMPQLQATEDCSLPQLTPESNRRLLTTSNRRLLTTSNRRLLTTSNRRLLITSNRRLLTTSNRRLLTTSNRRLLTTSNIWISNIYS